MKNFTFVIALSLLFAAVAAQQEVELPTPFCAAEFTEDSSSVNSTVTVEEADPNVKRTVEKIMSFTGLKQNFILMSYSRFNAAALIRNEDGQNKRYIFYNADFLNQIRQKAGDWGVTGTLAHEIAHHLQGHTVDYTKSSPKIELEADYYAGFIMAKMGARLDHAQSAFSTIAANIAPPGANHPVRDDRLDAVRQGWIGGGGQSDTDLVTAFITAAGGNDLTSLKKLLAAGVDVDSVEEHGYSALLKAISLNRLEAAKFLLDKGANPNVRGYANITPIFKAVENQNNELIKMLIEHGADVNAQSSGGANALTVALSTAQSFAPQSLALLVKAGIDVNQTVYVCRCKPLHLAVHRFKSYELVEELLKSKSIRINATDENGHTAMDWSKVGSDLEELLGRAGGKRVKGF